MALRTIEVSIDDRARLMSAVLSATDWPQKEQERRRHRAHVHARYTTRQVQAQTEHPAVRTLQTLLDQNTPLEAIYTYALSLSWPDLTLTGHLPWAPSYWNEQLGDFFQKTELAGWWAEDEKVWGRAREQAQKVISTADIYTFLKPFIGDITEQLVFMPNVSYPSDCEIGVRLDSQLTCVAPPRIAWGDNEPWPFDEDAAHVFRGALSEYGRLLMVSYLRQNAAEVAPIASKPLPVNDQFIKTHPTWGDQFTTLFVSGAVALFLEEAISKKEAQAYILMENRIHGVTVLPGVVSVLKRYLSEYGEGRYERFADFLPNFPKHLRVAKTIVSL
ncbi:MAG: hypothetical protein JW966_14590 [Anaerolineae bacterium]|nr:hypothetical protein [Anaerolineae bacterium]